MTRLAVFKGRVHMGGKTYDAGEHWVRPQDVQALIAAGTVKWADEKPKKTRKRKPKQ